MLIVQLPLAINGNCSSILRSKCPSINVITKRISENWKNWFEKSGKVGKVAFLKKSGNPGGVAVSVEGLVLAVYEGLLFSDWSSEEA